MSQKNQQHIRFVSSTCDVLGPMGILSLRSKSNRNIIIFLHTCVNSQFCVVNEWLLFFPVTFLYTFCTNIAFVPHKDFVPAAETRRIRLNWR